MEKQFCVKLKPLLNEPTWQIAKFLTLGIKDIFSIISTYQISLYKVTELTHKMDPDTH